MKVNIGFPNEFIIGNPDDKMQTRASLRKQASIVFVSQIKTKKVGEDLQDESRVENMKEELDSLNKIKYGI